MYTTRVRETILVYMSGALGDVILTSPALALVREWRPGACIHWITPASAHELYPTLHDGWTDINAASVAELFSEGAAASIARHGLWREAREAVVFESAESVLVRQLAGVLAVRAVDARPCACGGEHYSKWVWQRTVEALGQASEFRVPVPALRVPYEAPERPYAIVHPGSGSAKKCAPAELIWRVCEDAARGQRWRWVMLEGESDGEACAALQACWRGRVTRLRVANLRELGWYLAHAAYYVGHDSGVSHLAGVVGARGTVLFGPTDPTVWRPLGEHLKVYRF
ncbi:MAG: glycosyltransferase family 9 protein [bacterium]|nr:glycosyltransferase family 9 protein [bacterium]